MKRDDARNATGDLAPVLALHRLPGVGAAELRRLLDRFGSAAEALRAPPKELEDCGLSSTTIKGLRELDWDAVDDDLRWLEAPEHHLLHEGDPGWPSLLGQIPDPPAVLYCHGRVELLSSPQLAMVGSRNPTASGRETASAFAAHLSGIGLTITSGLAKGIDAAAHEGALRAGGPTLAVLGNGPDVIYPREHRDLQARIAEQGLVVSEFPPGTTPRRALFPRRNRIISGLSVGTLVVEAALRSGSLITARTAAEQGREVFALPGSIHNPLARGCHRLIRQGAKLVESAEDILEELGSLVAGQQDLLPATDAKSGSQADDKGHDLDPEYARLLEAVDFDPTPVDRIIERSGLTAASVSSMLLLLEMEGRVTAAPGGRYMRTS